MTIPFSQFSFARGVKGVATAGYRYVAWGPNEMDSAKRRAETLPLDAPPARVKELQSICRDAGLESVLMFASFYPENPGAAGAYKKRIDQAHAAGIPNLLAFGSPKSTPAQRPVFVRTLIEVAEHARQAKVTIAVKQHGGITSTGALTSAIVREVNHPNVVLFYDSGNVFWYDNVDANADFVKCSSLTRGFAIKDFRQYGGRRATCGPGFGQTDHYAMLGAVANAGGRIPLCCENLSEPFVVRVDSPEAVDALARRAREYLDTVVRGVTSQPKE